MKTPKIISALLLVTPLFALTAAALGLLWFQRELIEERRNAIAILEQHSKLTKENKRVLTDYSHMAEQLSNVSHLATQLELKYIEEREVHEPLRKQIEELVHQLNKGGDIKKELEVMRAKKDHRISQLVQECRGLESQIRTMQKEPRP